MKLITPEKARELSLSGYKIKCRFTREAETKFIEFLNKNLIPHGDLSSKLAAYESLKVGAFLEDQSFEAKIYSFATKTKTPYIFTNDMFLFFAVDL